MTAAIVPQDFYVYTHHKATTGEIFYVGKGQGRRAWGAAESKRSLWWLRTVRKHGVQVKIVQDGLQEWYALELERELIALHGRKELGQGPLVNMTDGGECNSGWVASEITRRRMHLAAIGKPKSNKKRVCCSNGETFESTKAVGEWLKQQSITDSGQGNVTNCCNGKQMTAYDLQWWYEGNAQPEKMSRAEVAQNKMKRLNLKRLEGLRLGRLQAPNKKVVVCNGLLQFESLSSAAEWVKQKRPEHTKAKATRIGTAAAGKTKTAYGYHWTFAPCDTIPAAG